MEKELQDTRDNLRTVTLENASLTKLVDEDKKKFEESVRVIANNKEVCLVILASNIALFFG